MKSLELNSESPPYSMLLHSLGGTSVLHRKQLLEKVNCLTRASHRPSPCILNPPGLLL